MNTETGGGRVRSGISKAATIIAVVLSALFVLFVINQTAQIVALADRVSPTLGTAVLWTLLALYAAAVGAVAFQYAKLPKPLRPPAGKDDPEFSRYIARLKARLRRNPYVEDMPLETEEDLEAALTVLAKRADEVTRTTALQVFLTTAISQNGSLDALAVLAAQSRMVLQIARIYNQRPSFRDLWWLYGNVAFAALLARQIEDMDMGEAIQPIVSSVMSSAVGIVPGMEAAATVFVQSVLTGSANAYVTLRVGVIAKRYSGSVTMPDVTTVRMAAFAEAMQMIPSVASQGAKAVAGVIKDTMAKSAFDMVRRAGSTTVSTAGDVSKKIVQGTKEVAATGVHTVRRWTNRLRLRPKARPAGGPAAAEPEAEGEET